eukprot:TRINITY_DN12043_c0_g1_i1.p1 TRINITY_DN12043_c0_g1~~TRINITY_DN12043_c0_g1_i1.p1  ORF type:complete len:191 (+),score=31.73 TRINITY_DN12043_c0_g1_i1:52-624(+)
MTSNRTLVKFGEFSGIIVEVYEEEEPVAAANFLSLVDSGFYDWLTVHKIIPGYAAHYGCPFTTLRPPKNLLDKAEQWSALKGCGTPEPESSFFACGKKHIRNEQGRIPAVFNSRLSNEKYTISMCNNGKNEIGSQIFFNLRDNPHLDWDNTDSKDKHVVIGKVIAGRDLIEGMCRRDHYEPAFGAVFRAV